MKRDSFKEYEVLLGQLGEWKAGWQERWPKVRRRAAPTARRMTLLALKYSAALVLPFFVLVGGSVFLYGNYGVPTWPALLSGVLLTTLILLVYAAWIARKLTGTTRVSRRVAKVTLAVVVAYSLYALIYLSSFNVKDTGIRSYYRSLHPLLRVAVSTFILVDSDLIITDMKREPHDYAKMGLPVSINSMHYAQEDGYVHAIDLRTIGRGRLRNWLVAGYFRAMGFRTLRHVGTADHLHVSLPPPS